jgi:hypothetical protein
MLFLILEKILNFYILILVAAMAPPPSLPPTIRLEGSEDAGPEATLGRRTVSGSRPVSIQFGSSLDSDYCKALYDYSAGGSDELSLHEDDIIHILSRSPNGVEDGWWLGELAGRTGLFPSIVVEECQANGDDWSPDVSLASPTASIAPPSFTPPPLDLPPPPPPPDIAAPSLPPLPDKPPPPLPSTAPSSIKHGPPLPAPAQSGVPGPLSGGTQGGAGLQLPNTKITITNPTPVVEDASAEREDAPLCYTVEDTTFAMKMSPAKKLKYNASSEETTTTKTSPPAPAAAVVAAAAEAVASTTITVEIIEPTEEDEEATTTTTANDQLLDGGGGEEGGLAFTEIVVTAPTPRNQSPDEENIRFDVEEAGAEPSPSQGGGGGAESDWEGGGGAVADDQEAGWSEGGADSDAADWANFQVGLTLYSYIEHRSDWKQFA